MRYKKHLEHIYISTYNICISSQIISSYHQHNAGSNIQNKKPPKNRRMAICELEKKITKVIIIYDYFFTSLNRCKKK